MLCEQCAMRWAAVSMHCGVRQPNVVRLDCRELRKEDVLGATSSQIVGRTALLPQVAPMHSKRNVNNRSNSVRVQH
jgi:hypothetical protein